MTILKNSFTLSKIDDINLKKYNLTLKELKQDIKKLTDILLNLKEIQNKKIFNEKIKKVKFDVCLCNDNTIHEINKEYRNKDKATDVITFVNLIRGFFFCSCCPDKSDRFEKSVLKLTARKRKRLAWFSSICRIVTFFTV